MKSKGANTVIAVDVGSEYPAELTNYGDHLSGWWLLWKKWNPFGEKIYVSAMWNGIVLWYGIVPCRAVAKESMNYCTIDRYKRRMEYCVVVLLLPIL